MGLRISKILFIICSIIFLSIHNLYSECHPAGVTLCKEDIWVEKVEKSKKKIIARSALKSTDKYNYEPENLIDGDKNTCWCTKNTIIDSSKECDNTFQFIIMKIPKEAKGFRIINGIAKSKEFFYANNRVKQIYWSLIIEKIQKPEPDVCLYSEPIGTIRNFIIGYKAGTNSPYMEQVFLKDSDKPQEIIFSKYSYFKENSEDEQYKKTRVMYLLISIMDIYKGSKYNDVCLSEIEIIK